MGVAGRDGLINLLLGRISHTGDQTKPFERRKWE